MLRWTRSCEKLGSVSVVVTLLLVSITTLSVGLGSSAGGGALAGISRFQGFDGNASSGSEFPLGSQDFASINTTGITVPTSYTSGWTVGLKATATGTGYSCAWTFGDGGTANTCTTTHTITANGNFTWSVTVTELDGNHPTASMGVFHEGCGSGSQECPDMFWCDKWYGGCGGGDPPGSCEHWCYATASAQLLDSTTGAISGASYSWSFGDGDQGTGDPITHEYANSGDYSVGVTATSGSSQYTSNASLRIPL